MIEIGKSMENVEEFSNDLDVCNQSWNKLIKNANKLGYREGLMDGKESAYQQYFDIGYEDGFRNGHMLGLQKGKIESQNSSKAQATEKPKGEIISPERGLCQICTNKELERESIASVIQLHSEICKASIASLLDIVETPPEEDQS